MSWQLFFNKIKNDSEIDGSENDYEKKQKKTENCILMCFLHVIETLDFCYVSSLVENDKS